MHRPRTRFLALALLWSAPILLLSYLATSKPTTPHTPLPMLTPISHTTTIPPTTTPALAKADFAHTIAPLLTQYCISCHSGPEPKGDLSLVFENETAVQHSLLADRSLWKDLASRVRKGQMPPARRPQPTSAQKDTLLAWVERDLLAVDCDNQSDPGHITLRRLNKAEYNNTIRDLFFIDNFKPADDFPADDAGYGFDNNGDTLSLSPVLIEQYLKAAEQVTSLLLKNKPARAKIFGKPGAVAETFYNRQERAKGILQAVLPRVYRKPVTDDQVERLMKFVRMSLSQDGESGDRAVMLALRAALVSPNFIFHLELDPGTPAPATASTLATSVVPVSEYELASRLSYFLWSSLPDDELFTLAAENKLRDNLPAQVRRMLKDPKAYALTENFAGQWLELRGLKDHAVDTALYPNFNDQLKADMIEETRRFFAAVVAEDRSILDFLDADFTFLNARLAKLYNISGINGDEFQRVALTGGRRGGVLTQASILTLTSTPTRTSPVKRGKWILDNILNAPPPPPPADVPALESDGKPLTGTLRQVMEKHRADPTCMSCHESIDPLGLAFENFDAIGAWRDTDGHLAIDSGGILKDGAAYKNVQDLRAILKSKAPDFRRALAEKMMLYALGRGLEAYDKCALDDVCSKLARDHDAFSSLILAITATDPFDKRKGTPQPAVAVK